MDGVVRARTGGWLGFTLVFDLTTVKVDIGSTFIVRSQVAVIIIINI